MRPRPRPAPPTAPSGPQRLYPHTPLARVVLSEVEPSSCPIRARLSRAPPPGLPAPLLRPTPSPPARWRRRYAVTRGTLVTRIMSLRVARSARAVACSLRTALASCPPRPWAPSAAAVRTLRTGSALLSGKCGARGHGSRAEPPGDVRSPTPQPSRPERAATLTALLVALGILVLRPFSLLK